MIWNALFLTGKLVIREPGAGMQEVGMKRASKTLRTFRRNVSGLGPLFFGPNSSLSRSLEKKIINSDQIRIVLFEKRSLIRNFKGISCSF